MDNKKQESGTRNTKKEEGDRDTIMTVIIPYIKGVSEAISWVFYRHGVAMAMKPHLTLKRMLVHPKDKRTPRENAVVVYQIPCTDCLGVYTGSIYRGT